MGKISFIHCSDLHLGCNQFNDPQRFNDFGAAFLNIVDYAIEQKVQYFFIGGDLFHHRNVNAQTLMLAISSLAELRAAGISVIAIEGNHDKAFYVDEESWMHFLNQQGYIKLLKPSFVEGKLTMEPYDDEKGCIIEADDMRIIGLGYLGATTKQRLEEASELICESDKFTVILLHAAVDKLLGQDLAGVTKDCFLQFSGKAYYFALGHIHSRQEHLDYIFNPGAPESVHIDEVKKNQEKGFYHVTVENKVKEVRFIPSERRQIRYFDIDITGVAAPSEVEGAVLSKLDAGSLLALDKPIVQVNIYGMVDFNSFTIDTGKISEKLKERYKCLAAEVINNANLVSAGESADSEGFDRSAVERLVISRMIAEERPEFRDIMNDMTDLVLNTKNNSLSGVSEDEIIDTIGRVLEQMALTEAAVSGEEAGA